MDYEAFITKVLKVMGPTSVSGIELFLKLRKSKAWQKLINDKNMNEVVTLLLIEMQEKDPEEDRISIQQVRKFFKIKFDEDLNKIEVNEDFTLAHQSMYQRNKIRIDLHWRLVLNE